MSPRRRVLFFAEAVTLAHVARPIVLAKALDPERYDVRVACDERYRRFVQSEGLQHIPLHSISSERFMAALAKGSPVYDLATLQRYAEEDRRLMQGFQPDLVVGDFRLSLSVSARQARIPYAALSNTYWSPYTADPEMPLPVLPWTRWLPLGLARRMFATFAPLAMGAHCRPLNLLRAQAGLPALPSLRHIYTDADHVLYADVPALFPTRGQPDNHHHLGPILWSPPATLPAWWSTLPADRPLVYVTLGSSGMASLLPRVVQCLAAQPVVAMVATAGAKVTLPRADNVFVADYLPGTEAAARSSVVVCNGGSPTSLQALSAGVPVLAIASNMDQFMNMAAIVRAGAGSLMRADRFQPQDFGRRLQALLGDPSCAGRARELATVLAARQAPETFAQLVPGVVRSACDAAL
ncbi:glycosyltransferase [Azohydromonas aeria]|uniref:glycosyltransferase n=1 Tax=Azohydromonas aeria TaxID=2590212 RepID=UPI0012F71B8E|nr:glycosyltransferase [Azohydromonas aeria]